MINNMDITPTPKTNVIAIIPTENVLISLSSSKQKTRGECAPRACKISFASATRLSQELGPVAFRPLITQGLALSAMSFYRIWLTIQQFWCQTMETALTN
jgi:hypothetical protein